MAPESHGSAKSPRVLRTGNSIAVGHDKSAKPDDDRAPEQREDEDETDETDEDEEPQLKYASLTKLQETVYRNGDAASASLVAGDKMGPTMDSSYVNDSNPSKVSIPFVIKIIVKHVFSLPFFQLLRRYHAHTASVSAISISPLSPPLPSTKPDHTSKLGADVADAPPSSPSTSSSSPSAGAKKPKKNQPEVPNTPSNAIYVGTSSIDGNVCICSLVNPDDVVLRKFGRPVHALALSPNFKADRTYLSGGSAGNLILTIGGKIGKTEECSAGMGPANPANWLGAIGLSSNAGTDSILHSGEGRINTIRWSLSGRFVVWVNEYGVKIMRSHLHLDMGQSELAWKRVSHIDRPNRSVWEEMASVWKGCAEWIDEDGLEVIGDGVATMNGHVKKEEDSFETQSIQSTLSHSRSRKTKKMEKLVVGWGDMIWIIHVHPTREKTGAEQKLGRAEIISLLRTDGVVCGVSLFTANLLLVLAYVNPPASDGTTNSSKTTPKRGITRRQNALQPEMRIIDLETGEENVADTLNVSRYESLSATDYHLGVLPVIRDNAKVINNKGALEIIGGIGSSIWDTSLYSGKLLGYAAMDATAYSAKLFSSGASVLSVGSSGDAVKSAKTHLAAKGDGDDDAATVLGTPVKSGFRGPHPALLTRGMKIFIQSPYDCVLATKPTISDHLSWLVEHQRYEEAWYVLDSSQSVVAGLSGNIVGGSAMSTPTKGQASLAEFLEDASINSAALGKTINSETEKEKRRIGSKWIQQLVDSQDWSKAGDVCSKVLQTASGWEHWVQVFADADRYSDIAPDLPLVPLHPPIPSSAYEVIINHFVSKDRLKLQETLDRWPADLYDSGSVIATLESKIRSKEFRKDTVEDGVRGRDWRILTECLARLYLYEGRAKDALKCYIRLQDADTAMSLIQKHHLFDAIADDIPGFILLRLPEGQLKDASLSEIEEATSESIRLLVSETYNGVVLMDNVVDQLKGRKDLRPCLFFYFRSLWNGDTVLDENLTGKENIKNSKVNQLITDGKSYVNDFGDVALPLFVDYDRDLLFAFLKSSQSYTLSSATSICEKRHYVPELVYLYAKEGLAKKALFLIIKELEDVPQAIGFCREQDDPDLWNDLLNYSMNKPAFIRALLEEAGTAIDPITIVSRIPEGLEISGLRDSLARMLREFEIQHSISEGVARVLRGEVGMEMSTLRAGQKRGVKFNVTPHGRGHQHAKGSGQDESQRRKTRRRIKIEDIKPGCCCGCGDNLEDNYDHRLSPESSPPLRPNPIVAFPCGHAFHLACKLSYFLPSFQPLDDEKSVPSPESKPPRDQRDRSKNEDAKPDADEDEEASGIELPAFRSALSTLDYGVSAKIRYAKDLRWRIQDVGEGCPLESTSDEEEEEE